MYGETTTVEARTGRLARLGAAFRTTFGLVVDIGLPNLCAACREPVGDQGLCATCWSKLSFIAPPYCERLGIPFPFDGGLGLLSMEAISDPPAYSRARAVVRYDDVARALVHAPPKRSKLDDFNNREEWPLLNGKSKDPWSETVWLPFKKLDADLVLRYSPITISGRRAASNLLKAYAEQTYDHIGQSPLVRFASSCSCRATSARCSRSPRGARPRCLLCIHRGCPDSHTIR